MTNQAKVPFCHWAVDQGEGQEDPECRYDVDKQQDQALCDFHLVHRELWKGYDKY